MRQLFRNDFIRFLKENNIYTSYITQLRNKNDIDVIYSLRPPNYLSGAFYFPDTKEGYVFWTEMNQKWLLTYAKNTII